MKKISKKKNLLTKTGLGVVAASLVMTPIVTAVACGADNSANQPFVPIHKSINTYEGRFSSVEKKEQFLNLTDEVPNNAFMNETGLISITLPDVLTVGQNAFSMTESSASNELVTVNLPKVITIKYNAFHNTSVKKIDFPNARKLEKEIFDSTNVTSISLPKIKSIGKQVFRNFSEVTSLNLPLVTEIEDFAFADTWKLENIILPQVKIIGKSAFASDLSALKIKNISLPEVENIGEAAFRGREFKDLSISFSKVEEIGAFAFFSASFTAINFPSLKLIGQEAFQLSVLTSLVIPKLTMPGVIGSSTFSSTADGAEVYVDSVQDWTNPDPTFQARRIDIFGLNAPSIQWKTA